MIDPGIIIYLNQLEKDLNFYIDELIALRQCCQDEDKATYRYINNKLQIALGAINKSLDKIEGK